MNEGSSFSRRIPGLTRNSRTSELESFLDSLPQAALLVNSENWRIFQANLKAIELTNFRRQELIGLDARMLFASRPEEASTPPDHPLIPLARPPTFAQPSIHYLIRHDQTLVVVRLSLAPLKNRETLNLLFIEPTESLPDNPDQMAPSPFWEGLNQLFCSGHELDLQTCLASALAAARSLSGAEALAIYRLGEMDTLIQRLATDGAADLLPDYLSAQDLGYLNQARLWETGKHPACQLYRVARSAGIHYLASAPVGQKNAIIAVTVLAGTRTSTPRAILEITRLLAIAIESIIQNQTLISNLNNELYHQAMQIRALTSIAERVQEGVIRLSPDLRIRSLNPRMEQIFGYTSREMANQSVESILIGHDSLREAFSQAQKGEPIYNFGDAKFYRRNGEAFLALLRIFPVFAENQVEEILVFIQDLSEQEQFRTQTQELQNRALLGELTAVFAHEIRNPINNISTGLQLMSMNMDSDNPDQAAITRMLQDCDRLEELIRSVLVFSKPAEYEMETLDLAPLLRRLLERLRQRIEERHVQYDLRVEPDCPLVFGNLRALEQVFSNLITNALHAMSEMDNGNLAIKVQPIQTEEDSKYVEVSVADSGPGIPKEFQERIFQPFYTTKRDGTGLGLPLSQRIITAHKGNIQFSSFPGGTIFHVRLPAAEADQRNS